MGLKERATRLAILFSIIVTAIGIPAAPLVEATNIGNEGCTPGYWKNHTSNWEDYSPTQTLDDLFNFPDTLASFRDDTLLQALSYPGGSGLEGGARILLRAAVAAFLNAAHEGLGYPYRRFDEPFNIEAQVNDALDGTRAEMLALAGTLDAANNLGCPLD